MNLGTLPSNSSSCSNFSGSQKIRTLVVSKMFLYFPAGTSFLGNFPEFLELLGGKYQFPRFHLIQNVSATLFKNPKIPYSL